MLFIFSNFYVRSLVFVFNKNMLKKSLKIGLPIMISAVFGIVVNFSDKFLLQRYGTMVDLSNYYLAFSFASIIPLIFSSVQNVWLPLFMKERDIQQNFRRTQKLLVKLVLVFVVLSLAIWLLFDVLLWTKIIPIKYNAVVWILPILLLTQIFAALTPLFSNYLIFFEKTNLVIISGLFIVLISIFLGLWIIPLWGILGAAITTLVVNFLYLAVYYYVVLFLKEKYSVTSTLP
jgi:O-antigen/teichoic acid export membrane protein